MKNVVDSVGRFRGPGAVLVGAGVSVFAFVLYLMTLAPTVLYYARPIFFDSAMLQAEVSVLGIGHPSGYPTYMMLTHLFTYLPFWGEAHLTNLASAVYGAVSVALFYAISLRLSGRVVAAATGALAFAVSATFWSQAVITEVYTLNALFISLVVLILLVWRDTQKDRYLLLAAFVVGISLTHHLTSGLLLPGGFAFVFLTERRKLAEVGLMLKAFGLFLLGLTPYIYLPVRALMNAPLTEADPSTLGRFLLLVTGSSLWVPSLQDRSNCAPSPFLSVDFPERLRLYGGHLLGQFPVVLMLVGALGVVYLLFTDRALAALLGIVSFGVLAQSLAYLKGGTEDYFVFPIPAYLSFGLCISVGLGLLLRRAESLQMRPGVLKKVVLILVSLLMLAAPFIGIQKTYEANDQSHNYEGRRIVDAVVRETKPNATVLHHRSPLWYMVLAEKKRRDLTLMDPFCTSWVRYRDIVWPGSLSYQQAAARYKTGDTTGVAAAREAAKKGPVYILAQEFKEGKTSPRLFEKAGFRVVPVEKGILYQLVPREGR